MIDINEILKILPNRYPFLLVDKVVEFEAGKKAKGIKNVTINENFFQGHFPNHPVMPGVLIIESIAQTAAVFVVETLGEKAHGKVVYFMSSDRAKSRRPVVPGDQLRIHVTRDRARGWIWKVNADVKVDGVT